MAEYIELVFDTSRCRPRAVSYVMQWFRAPAARQVLVSVGHGAPAGQQARPGPVPQAIVPAGQPHVAVDRLTHALPLAQQARPQGVVPAGQQAAHFPPMKAQKSPWF